MDRNAARAKLAGLSVMLDNLLEVGHRSYPCDEVVDLFDRYDAIRDALKTDDPSLFGDIPVRTSVSKLVAQMVAPARIESRYLDTLRRDINYIMTVLAATPPAEGTTFRVDREGVFFTGEVFDALRHIDSLITGAKNLVAIIDGYVSEKVLDLLSAKGKEVRVEIMMKPSQATPTFRAHADAFNTQYGRLTIHLSEAFHDRFVIVDDAEFYHFGASLKDAGRRGFMFSRVEEPSVVDELRRRLRAEWQKAEVLL